jgi:hypothetical protein
MSENGAYRHTYMSKEAAWGYTYPSEKYDFVTWGYHSQYTLVMTNIAMVYMAHL